LAILPKICVSIAARSLEELENNFSLAKKSGADFLEIRFDFLQTSEFEVALQKAERLKNKAIYTLRNESELGNFRGSEEERAYWITRLADAKPMLLDIEFSTLKVDQRLENHLRKNNTPILISWHNTRQTPNLDELRSLMFEMKKLSKYVKIVTMAESIEDSISILELYRDAIDTRLIAFAMGEKGILSRLLCGLCESAPFTYASLGSEIAPGQMSINQMRRLYDRIVRNNGIGANH